MANNLMCPYNEYFSSERFNPDRNSQLYFMSNNIVDSL